MKFSGTLLLLLFFAFLLLLPASRLRTATGVCPSTGVPNVFNVKDFGAVGNGTTDDRPWIQAAIDAAQCIGGGVVYVPTGTYLISSPGSGPYLTDNGAGKVHLKGAGIEVAKLLIDTSPPPSGALIKFSGNNWSISDLSIDMGNVDPTDNYPAIGPSGDFWSIQHVNIDRIIKTGISCNGTYWRIEDCFIRRTSLVPTCGAYNGAILVTPAEGAPVTDHGIIKNNQVINGTITVNGLYMVVEGNTVAGFGCGSGIVGGRGDGQFNVISNNIITGGRGNPSGDGSYPQGIQNWMPSSVISGNIVYDNDGVGINQGGDHCVVIGNIGTNNAKNVPNQPPTVPFGIGTTAGCSPSPPPCAIRTASYSIFAANQSYNSVTNKQLYGFYSNSPLVDHLRVIGNNFNQNPTEASISNPLSENNLPGISGEMPWTPNPNPIPNGTGQTISVSVAGSSNGDFVDASYSANLQGVRLFGWVNTSGTVQFRMENNTGGPKTIAAGATLYWVVRKGFHAGPY
jgi:pectate lyase-like protein